VRSVQGSTRRHCVAVFSIVLIAAALLTSGVNCDDGYRLTISSTTGGSVTVPGEGTRSYDAGTVVQLMAVPDEGYGFQRWTGDTAHIADINAASTTITMNGNYSISATFGEEGEDDEDEDPITPIVPTIV